jgi:C-terminal processing protease CtpA/Prc
MYRYREMQSESEDEQQRVTFDVIHLTVNKGSGAMGFSINYIPDKSKPGFLTIGTVRQGSPAATAGMLKDDYLLQVDSKELQFASKDEGTAAIKDTGAVVQVTIGRIAPVWRISSPSRAHITRSLWHRSHGTVWTARSASC